MGYAQSCTAEWGAFSNFAISFSIICILSGGINRWRSDRRRWRSGHRDRLAARLPGIAGVRGRDGTDLVGLPDRGRSVPLGLNPR
jgi:hypothetical protein